MRRFHQLCDVCKAEGWHVELCVSETLFDLRCRDGGKVLHRAWTELVVNEGNGMETAASIGAGGLEEAADVLLQSYMEAT